MCRKAVVMVVSAALLAGCGQSTIKPHGAERVVVNVVHGQTGFRPTDVHCPSGVAAKVGVTFECHFTGPEGPYTAHMRVTKVQGTKVVFAVRTLPSADGKLGPLVLSTMRSHGGTAVNPQSAKQAVVDVVAGQTGYRPGSVQCPPGVPAKVGVTFVCHFTGPDGPYDARIRIAEVRGERVLVSVVSRRSA